MKTGNEDKLFLKERFRGFTVDTKEEDAKEIFKSIYGYEPAVCKVHKGLLLVGPITKEQ